MTEKNQNIGLYYLLEALLSLLGGVILPVYVCYFRLYDITLFQIALLAVVFEASIILFELPTGLFADRFGRKISTIIGFFLYGIAGFVFFSVRNFYGFLAAEIIFGLAETFISGALEALIVDDLDKRDKDSQLSRLFASRTAFKTAALLVGMISGGLLAQAALPFLFLPVIAIAMIGLVFSLMLIESKPGSSIEQVSILTKPKSSLFSIITSNRAILALFIVGLSANFAFEPADQYWQVLFSENKSMPLSSFGLMTASGLVIVTLIARLTAKLYQYLKIYLFGCFILAAISLYIMVASGVHPAVAGILIYFIVRELVRPAISTHLNQQFKAENRATYLSAYNLTCSIGEVTAGLLAGFLASGFGLKFIFYFAAAAAVLVPILFSIAEMKFGER